MVPHLNMDMRVVATAFPGNGSRPARGCRYRVRRSRWRILGPSRCAGLTSGVTRSLPWPGR